MQHQIYVGSGHGAWEPTDSDPNPYLQVDFPVPYELKAIITQVFTIYAILEDIKETVDICILLSPTNTG